MNNEPDSYRLSPSLLAETPGSLENPSSYPCTMINTMTTTDTSNNYITLLHNKANINNVITQSLNNT